MDIIVTGKSSIPAKGMPFVGSRGKGRVIVRRGEEAVISVLKEEFLEWPCYSHFLNVEKVKPNTRGPGRPKKE